MPTSPTLRNQYIANRLCIDARHLEQRRNQTPALSNHSIAAALGVGESYLTNLIANAPTEVALAAIVPCTITNV